MRRIKWLKSATATTTVKNSSKGLGGCCLCCYCSTSRLAYLPIDDFNKSTTTDRIEMTDSVRRVDYPKSNGVYLVEQPVNHYHHHDHVLKYLLLILLIVFDQVHLYRCKELSPPQRKSPLVGNGYHFEVFDVDDFILDKQNQTTQANKSKSETTPAEHRTVDREVAKIPTNSTISNSTTSNKTTTNDLDSSTGENRYKELERNSNEQDEDLWALEAAQLLAIGKQQQQLQQLQQQQQSTNLPVTVLQHSAPYETNDSRANKNRDTFKLRYVNASTFLNNVAAQQQQPNRDQPAEDAANHRRPLPVHNWPPSVLHIIDNRRLTPNQLPNWSSFARYKNNTGLARQSQADQSPPLRSVGPVINLNGVERSAEQQQQQQVQTTNLISQEPLDNRTTSHKSPLEPPGDYPDSDQLSYGRHRPIGLFRDSADKQQDNDSQLEQQDNDNNANVGRHKQHQVQFADAANNPNMTWTQLIRLASMSNIVESLMVTNRSIVSLTCDTNDMLVRFKFQQPFKGIISTDIDSNSRLSCRLVGNGSHYYELRISLHSCGTRQELPRVFVNVVQIQFLRSRESAHDEIKNIVCSYPLLPQPVSPVDKDTVDRFEKLNNRNLSERIIEVPDNLRPSNLSAYYEPLLLIAGMLLLLLAFVGIATSVFLASRAGSQRRRRVNPTDLTQHKSIATANRLVGTTNGSTGIGDNKQRRRGFKFLGRGNNFGSMRFYGSSPAQLANKRHSDMKPIAPPLVSVEPAKQQRTPASRGQQLSTGRQTTMIKPRSPSSSSNSSSERAIVARYGANATRVGVDGAGARSATPGTSGSKQQVNGAGGGTEDSLESENNRSSVTTIEIPYRAEKSEPEEVHTTTLTKTNIITKKSLLSGRLVGGTGERENEPPAKQTRPPDDELRKGSGTTSPMSAKKSTSDTKSTFGSLRKTLTSPEEFKRLQYIAWMVNRIQASDKDAGTPNTIDLKEKTCLDKLLNDDEIFRSYVVDSTNREVFRRKLRDNPVYSDRLKPSTWKLLEDLVVDGTQRVYTSKSDSPPDVDRSSKQTKPLPISSYKKKTVEKIDRETESITKRTTRIRSPLMPVQTDLDGSDSLDSDRCEDEISTREKYEQQTKRLTSTKSNDNGHKQQPVVRVSQFNTTETDDSGTRINIDSVTRFSTSKDFKAYMRSSIEQTTSYMDSLVPYMDDDNNLATTSTDRQGEKTLAHKGHFDARNQSKDHGTTRSKQQFKDNVT